ncbi:MAG: DUF1257 domain-containing protein [Phycisphaerales bacterium]
MSSVIVLTPIVVGSFPMIASAAAAVAGSMGFAVAASERVREGGREGVRESRTTVEAEVPNSEVLEEEVGAGRAIMISQGGVNIEFRRDARGRCKVCASGDASKAELKRLAEDAAGRLVQQFAYHKLATELKARGFAISRESVGADDSIQLRVQQVNA